MCNVKGFIRPGKGVYGLRYVKGGSVLLQDFMYSTKSPLFLNRKYVKIQTALQFNSELKLRKLYLKPD